MKRCARARADIERDSGADYEIGIERHHARQSIPRREPMLEISSENIGFGLLATSSSFSPPGYCLTAAKMSIYVAAIHTYGEDIQSRDVDCKMNNMEKWSLPGNNLFEVLSGRIAVNVFKRTRRGGYLPQRYSRFYRVFCAAMRLTHRLAIRPLSPRDTDADESF